MVQIQKYENNTNHINNNQKNEINTNKIASFKENYILYCYRLFTFFETDLYLF